MNGHPETQIHLENIH